MKTHFFILIAAIATLTACNQTGSSSEATINNNEWDAECAISQSTTYKVYFNENLSNEGLVILGVSKVTNESGKVAYYIYTNFSKNYINTSSLSTIRYDEEEIPVILKYLDKCQAFNPEEMSDAMQELWYHGKEGYAFRYCDKQLIVTDANNVRYVWDMSLTEIRNLFAGAQSRIQELKKEEEK